jgi:1-acyl-sn-glycerol-3-phosphate acyltransferase
VLASPLPWWLRDRIFPIPAGDVFFEVPAVAAFAALVVNALPMWRKNCGPQALLELRQRLTEEPCAYILFPEGGRSRDGKMRPFKSGLGMLVAGTEVPVVPCHLRGCFAALRAGSKLPRPRPIELRVGPALTFSATPNQRAGWEQVAASLRTAIEELANDDRALTRLRSPKVSFHAGFLSQTPAGYAFTHCLSFISRRGLLFIDRPGK